MFVCATLCVSLPQCSVRLAAAAEAELLHLPPSLTGQGAIRLLAVFIQTACALLSCGVTLSAHTAPLHTHIQRVMFLLHLPPAGCQGRL
jgi:hypothetical protein